MMDSETLKKNIKEKSHDKWYIFCGEEDYLKRYYLRALASSLCPDKTLESLNHIIFDGPDASLAEIYEAAVTPPVMSEHKFVEWRNADLEHLKEKELRALENIFSERSTSPDCVLAISASEEGLVTGTQKKPGKLFTRLSKIAAVVAFPRSSDRQLLSWLKKHFDREGIRSDAASLGKMLLRCGHSMDVLENETEKLCAYLKQNGATMLTTDTVEAVTSPISEADAFGLSNAILDRDLPRALAALSEMKARRVEAIVAIASISKIYSSLASVSVLLSEGKNSAEIAQALRIGSSYSASLYIKGASKRSTRALVSASKGCLRLDTAAKSGGQTGYSPIERFLAEYI